MVQIVVKMENNDSCPEWLLFELQGHLESRHEGQLAGNLIGDLHFNKQGIPIFIIGHHILYGKVVKLDKPFIVMQKHDECHQETMEPMETDSNQSAGTQIQKLDETHYMVNAVIRRKLVFKTRPKPIITNVPKKVF
ncbi:chromosome transmission fidelity protein 8 homolog [Anneissia japonica]|uniref:chromosome transmission fidelity protein 8 homolog n=1 Tax=Anneissia japonica TaxID=1529436 RepID=UPI0014254C69|nr:chromosome transmission fidelity protein 8 homolog [Anneissia japonica]